MLGQGRGRGDGVPCDVDGDCADAFAELLDCEAAVCGDEGVCVIGAEPDGSACRDGLACTDHDYCLQGQCVGRTVECDDDDPCTSDGCDNKSGCYFTPQSNLPCSDDNPCTVGDACVTGECIAGPLEEGCCRFDGDCDDANGCTDDRCVDGACTYPGNFAPCDDGDVCTVTDHCDGEGACGGEPRACTDGNPCTIDRCDPATGFCESEPSADDAPCEDGNTCTVDDVCRGGACLSGPSLCECTTDADCVPMEDDDLCNGTLRCTNLRCETDPLTVVACNPTGDSACVQNTCDPTTGQCRPLASGNGAFCDDQNPCTDVDQCQNGLCLGVATDCDDDNPCTFDACSPVLGCQHSDNNLSCSDGSACTVNDQCDGGVCVGLAIGCDDGNPCTDDQCDDAAGCRHVPNTTACDDGDDCTPDDACAGGVCRGGASDCGPCDVDADCAAFEDGNRCNGTLVCRDRTCVVDAATLVVCPSAGDTACRKNRCVPTTGACAPDLADDGTPCTDGTSCTLGDACADGVCTGAAVDCDDGNPCTNDACDAAQGCRNVAHSSSCNDGNACTTGDVCMSGVCAGVLLVCNDGNQCTIDSCDTQQGCRAVNAASTTPCNDGSACTTNDRCNAGACTGAALVCADTNPCTRDACAPASGCTFVATPNGGACDDGDACTTNDECQGGACDGDAVVCDDGNDCTLDVCVAATGCEASELPDGEPCSDGDACSGPDACGDGVCEPGPAICTGCIVDGCPDPGQCKSSTCDEDSGLCVTTNVGGACNDGNACTSGDTCTAGACGGSAVVCNDNNACTDDACDPALGCRYTNDNGNGCADTNLCNGTETCSAGVCQPGTGLVCNDGNVCTTDGCAPATGCTFTNNTASCADADLCDGSEACSGGACPSVGASPVNCNDSNACTTDACTPATGQCTNTVIAGCAPDITCSGTPLTQAPNNDGSYDAVALTATLVAAGAGGVTYTWAITASPGGASNARPANASAQSTSFTPDIGGSYTLTVTARDANGATDTCQVTLTAQVTEALRIELVWDQAWGDADLHLARPNASLPGDWFSDDDDCWFDNCTNGLNWGQPGQSGNPSLDRDDANGFGPENINIATAPVGAGVYTIAVSFYCQHSLALRGGQAESPVSSGNGPVDATVRVHCGGAVTEIEVGLDETGQFIVVGTVTMPGCDVDEAIDEAYVGDVQTGPGLPFRCDAVPGPDGHHTVPACTSDGDCLSGEYCRTDTTPDVCYLETP